MASSSVDRAATGAGVLTDSAGNWTNIPAYPQPNSPAKIPFSVDRSPNPTICLIPGPVRPMMPNGIQIRFSVFRQGAGQTDAPDAQTDRESLIAAY